MTEIVKAGVVGQTGLPDGGKHKLTYDAWNRLVLIERWTVPAAPDLPDYRILARYDYNGVHHRTRKLAYLNPAGQVVAGGPTAQERIYVHNASWQAVAEIIDDDRPTSGSYANLTTDRIVHQFFGLRGINDALIRREDRGVYHLAMEESLWQAELSHGVRIPVERFRLQDAWRDLCRPTMPCAGDRSAMTIRGHPTEERPRKRGR